MVVSFRSSSAEALAQSVLIWSAITPEGERGSNTVSLGGGRAASWAATLDGLSVNTDRSAGRGETAYLTPPWNPSRNFQIDTGLQAGSTGQAGGSSDYVRIEIRYESVSWNGYGFCAMTHSMRAVFFAERDRL